MLDDGAARAITEGKKSLLAAGITEVEGTFQAGDVVELVDTRGEILAKGIAAYDSAQVEAENTDLGPVVHRDYLAETRY